jgi:hypothetical protein
MVLGWSRWDDDPRVAAVKEEYEAFYLTPEGRAVEAARGRAEFAALPETTKDRLEELSRALHFTRMQVRAERNAAN